MTKELQLPFQETGRKSVSLVGQKKHLYGDTTCYRAFTWCFLYTVYIAVGLLVCLVYRNNILRMECWDLNKHKSWSFSPKVVSILFRVKIIVHNNYHNYAHNAKYKSNLFLQIQVICITEATTVHGTVPKPTSKRVSRPR